MFNFLLIITPLLLGTACKTVGKTTIEKYELKSDPVPELEEAEGPSAEEKENAAKARQEFVVLCQSGSRSEALNQFLGLLAIVKPEECEEKYDAIVEGGTLSIGSAVADLSYLAYFPNLRDLTVASYDVPIQASGFEAIGQLRQLEMLRITNSNLSDISWVEKLGKIYSLDFEKNQIKDISVLGRISSLFYLNLAHNHIAEADMIIKNLDLREIDLSWNQLTTMPDFLQLSDPHKIYIHNNKITDVRRLAGVWATEIDISNNLIEDVNPIFRKRVRFTSFNRITLRIGCNPLSVPIDATLPEKYKWGIDRDGKDCRQNE